MIDLNYSVRFVLHAIRNLWFRCHFESMERICRDLALILTSLLTPLEVRGTYLYSVLRFFIFTVEHAFLESFLTF
jgi:hypothetical protein